MNDAVLNNNGGILLDCDPGIDDAFALFCALKYGRVSTVTTVSGNVTIENTTRNALFLLELAGSDVDVHRGADKPLKRTLTAADYIHGSSGLGNFDTPEPQRSEQPTTAVEAIIAHCEAGDATIVATGPLTNIALALEADPTLRSRISDIYWMGGGTTTGNVTEVAEFNAWCDPDAAAATLESGVRLTMFDLDLTHQVRMGTTEINRLRAAGTETTQFFADALEYYLGNAATPEDGKAMHDPCAVLGFLRPDLFAFAESNIVCRTGSDDERGRTVVDFTDPNPPHGVAVSVDHKEVIELILMAIIDPGGTP